MFYIKNQISNKPLKKILYSNFDPYKILIFINLYKDLVILVNINIISN